MWCPLLLLLLFHCENNCNSVFCSFPTFKCGVKPCELESKNKKMTLMLLWHFERVFFCIVFVWISFETTFMFLETYAHIFLAPQMFVEDLKCINWYFSFKNKMPPSSHVALVIKMLYNEFDCSTFSWNGILVCFDSHVICIQLCCYRFIAVSIIISFIFIWIIQCLLKFYLITIDSWTNYFFKITCF